MVKADDLVERMAALALVPPFDRLTGRELLLVAEQSRLRHFAAGQLLIAAGAVAEMLYVVIGGSARMHHPSDLQSSVEQADVPAAAHGPLGPRPSELRLFDIASLLFSLPVEQHYSAGPNGLQALCLPKPHIFTIARECPDFIAALLDFKAMLA